MTEIEISAPQTVEPSQSATTVAQGLAAQVEALDSAWKLAQSICKTSLAGPFQGKAQDGAVAILAGQRWGLDALASLQNIFVVKGTPSTYARVMQAVVVAAGHEMWVDEVGPTKAVICGRRRGSEHVVTSEWTIERAQQAGYASNAKYKSEPENMLFARATAECARRLAPDALLGMPYSTEELRDQEPIKRATVVQGKPSRGTAGLKAALSAKPVVDVSHAEIVQEDSDGPASAEQVSELVALFEARDIYDGAEWLAVNDITADEVGALSELTAAQAAVAIENLS